VQGNRARCILDAKESSHMWIFFFIIALIAVMGLLFHLVIQLNELEKRISSIAESIRKHYGIT